MIYKTWTRVNKTQLDRVEERERSSARAFLIKLSKLHFELFTLLRV